MKILSNEGLLLFNKNLANIIGLNESIVLQQIHYWMEINKKNNRNFHEGRYWTYNTYDAWNEEFPFWSKETIKRTFKRLRDRGLVVVGNFNKYQMDRTLWYSIDYKRINELLGGSKDSSNFFDSKGSKSTDRDMDSDPMDKLQNESMDDVNSSPAIPEIYPEISPENSSPSVREEEEDEFQEKYKEIIERCSIDNISSIYRDAAAYAIKLLVKDVDKKDLDKLDFYVVDHALDKFKKASRHIKINNSIAYLKSCIYNAIHEMDLDIEADLRYSGLIE